MFWAKKVWFNELSRLLLHSNYQRTPVRLSSQRGVTELGLTFGSGGKAAEESALEDPEGVPVEVELEPSAGHNERMLHRNHCVALGIRLDSS